MFKIIIDSITLILIIFLLITLHKYFNIVSFLQKKVSHLSMLLDIAACGMCSPMHRALYEKFYKMDPDKALEKMKDKEGIMREISSEGYLKTRKALEKIKNNTEDPIQKELFEEAINELDGVYNLLSTIDKKTSPEHTDQIMNNVFSSLEKLKEKGFDIRMGGL